MSSIIEGALKPDLGSTMRKSKATKQYSQADTSPYELHRSLPNPLFAGAPTRQTRSRHLMQQPIPVEQPKTHKVRKAVITTLILLLVVAIGYGGWVGFKAVDNLEKVFGWKGLFSLFFPSHLNGEDSGRVNILIAGNSADDPGHDGANLTDSIMLVSIDTQKHTAYMLSVPRDLYVNIPGFGYAKINEAYPDGQSENFSQPGYTNGGMGLLEEVVSQKFGIPINYTALVNYGAVKDSVNAVGGITVTINSPDGELYDPSRDFATGGPLVDLTNGVHTLNGEQALDLARARGDPSQYGEPIGFEQSDFQRTADQRMILVALESKALTLGVVTNPIKMGELFDTLGSNVQTNLSLGNVRRLYTIMKKIPSADIQSESLNSASYNGQKDVDLLTSYYTPTGEDALIPAAGIEDYTQIDDFVQQLDNQ